MKTDVHGIPERQMVCCGLCRMDLRIIGLMLVALAALSFPLLNWIARAM